MKTRYYGILAAMALLAGCNKEMQEIDNPAGEETSAKTVLEVGIVSETKTHMDPTDDGGHKVYWSNGDAIRVNGEASDELADLAENTQSASFTFSTATLIPPFNILYPASAWEDADHITLPAIQTYKADGFEDGFFPMAGHSADGTGLGVNHLCALVKILVKRETAEEAETRGGEVDTDNIACIRFKGGNSEKVSGVFGIDYTVPSLAAETGSDADLEVRVVKSQATSATAITYYLVVPARTYANGFDIIVQDTNGHIMTKSKSGETTLTAGKLYNMTAFAFVPTGSESGIEIDSAEDLIAFATAYNNNEYAGLRSSLIATITDNIVFDASTSALFNATGGIGTSDNGHGDTNYFNGILQNGGDYTISGLVATVPVIAFTGDGGIIKGLTLDNTCSYTVNTSTGNNHGALVGRNKGIVKDCTSAASVIINNIQDVTTANQNYGGLVGYNPGGTIDGCTVSGDITCSQSSQTITENSAYIGGIAGYQQNEGTIKDCTFTGNITISDATTYGGITAAGKNFYVAGILGRAEKAVISGCTAGIDGTARAIEVRGTFVPAIGGIVGWLATAADSEIDDCHNYMSLSFASNGARADTSPCRIGGIAGRSSATVKNSTNAGSIASVCNSTTLDLAGIVADGVNVSDCTNHAGGTITRSNANQTEAQANRYIYLGGIIGTLNAAGDITDCTNHAAITCNPTGTSSNTTVDLGGILGGANASQVDISGCTNNGEILFDNNNASAAALARKALGGILGNASTAGTTVTGCSNSGKVWSDNNTEGICGLLSIGGTIGHVAAGCIVTDCTNSGQILCQNLGNNINAYVDLGGIVGFSEAAITITGTSADATLNSGKVMVDGTGSAIVYARNTQGGILGYSNANNTIITNCKNTNEINCTLNTNGKNRPAYTGGIVGILGSLTYQSNAAKSLGALTGLEIGHCNNTGKVYSADYSNTAGNKNSAFAGGIAGLVSGTTTSPASIHDCTVGTSQVYVYRGTGGGLMAYANYCTLENNTCSADMSGVNASVNGVGGIVGRMFDSSMTNCTFSGKIARALKIGGLVYTLSDQNGTGSTISGCKVNGATLTTGTGGSATAAAVLVSETDAKANTITNCGVKGTLNGAAITLSSNMITTDGGTTVTGTYLIP